MKAANSPFPQTTPEKAVNPSAAPLPFPVGKLPLGSLVHHRHAVAHDTKLEVVHQIFRERDVEFLAVCRETQVIGIVGRGRLGILLGSRFGFSLYSQSPAEQFMLPGPLIVVENTAVPPLLDRALSRQGDAFYEDVLLVGETGGLVGLINVETLARLQTRLVAEQMTKLERQHDTLRKQNLTLFHTNHALRQSWGLYQGLFESEALGVALLGVDGAVELHNRRFGELVGLRESATDGVGLLDRLAPRDRADFLGLLGDLEQGRAGVDSTQEILMSVAPHKRRRFRITTGWIRETGQICACFDDVTEQRALEQLMMREEKQNLLDTLVGGIAHELNNKLTPVLAFAELLRDQVDARLAFHTEAIRSSAEEAAKIIRQLLQFSRPSDGDLAFVDLGKVVDDCLPVLRITLRDHCDITVTKPDDPVLVWGDAGQLKQILVNLAVNARHAVENVADPQVRVIVEQRGDRAELVVEDNGCGITAEVQQRIFDPFFTTKSPDRGSGLGLSICFSIARRHEGEIVVQSEPGEGARFVLSLPRGSPEAIASRTPALFLPNSAEPRRTAVRRRVLVVEDEDVLRSVLQEMLRAQFGCEVEMVENGEFGVEAIKSRTYDLVISDIRMPKMNGVEFYHALHALRPELAERFVFVTGYAGEAAVPGRPVPRGVPVLAKPFSLQQLEAMCGPYLRGKHVA